MVHRVTAKPVLIQLASLGSLHNASSEKLSHVIVNNSIQKLTNRMAGFVECADHLGKLHGIEQFLLIIDIATHNHGLSGYPPEKGASPC